ncbi:hypothetical protein GGI07_000225 [Coemansia sp. Benny D115]|nr:hypothetical protein GGI07_000225 [Coemansia sp. Benny D115]
MSNLYNQAAGATKEAIGNALGKEDLAEAGHKQWAEGKGGQTLQNKKAEREEAAPNAYRVGDSFKNAGGLAKEKIGQFTNNDEMQKEGRSERAQAIGQAEHHEKLADKQAAARENK